MTDGLIHAIVEKRDLEMHFMPIVRFWAEEGTSRWSPFALEALIRGPRNSLLRRPDELFAAASRAGIQTRLELICLEAAFELLPELPSSVLLFLNVGVPTFVDREFEAFIERWEGRIDPSRIIFEIVEGPVLSIPKLRRQLERGMARGFRFALDDLSTDLDAIKRMVEAGPVAFMKIDRSFNARWMGHRTEMKRWLRFVSSLARSVDAELVVEGIEPNLLDALPELSSLGVQLAQGFLFGEPSVLEPGFQRWRKGVWKESGTDRSGD